MLIPKGGKNAYKNPSDSNDNFGLRTYGPKIGLRALAGFAGRARSKRPWHFNEGYRRHGFRHNDQRQQKVRFLQKTYPSHMATNPG
jgi:hypothetical protein